MKSHLLTKSKVKFLALIGIIVMITSVDAYAYSTFYVINKSTTAYSLFQN